MSDYNAAYDEGVKACEDGFLASTNPYWPHDPQAASYWAQGFDDALVVPDFVRGR